MPINDPQTPEPPIVVDQIDAKAGTREGVTRWVLLISLTLAIAALTVIWVTGALNPNTAETQSSVTGVIEREGTLQTDETLAESADLVGSGTTERPAEPSEARQSGIAPNK